MKSRKLRRAARNSPQRAHVLILAGSALLMLLILGVWERAGAFSGQFWVESAWVAGGFLAAALLVRITFTLAQRVVSSTLYQPITYAATPVGLLLMGGIFWVQGMDALGRGASAFIMWDALPAVLGAAAIPFLLAAVSLQASLLPARRAWDTRRLDLRAINVILLLSITAVLLLPGGAAAWDQAQTIQMTAVQSVNPFFAVAAGPAAWFMPVLAIAVALFAGQIALQMLRRPGVVVMIFAAALFYQAIANFVFVQDAGYVGLDATAHLLALFAAIVMDAAYMLRLHIADDRRTLWYALAACILSTAGAALILLPGVIGHPPATVEAIAGVVAGSALVGLWVGWCGAKLGCWLHSLPAAESILQVSS